MSRFGSKGKRGGKRFDDYWLGFLGGISRRVCDEIQKRFKGEIKEVKGRAPRWKRFSRNWLPPIDSHKHSKKRNPIILNSTQMHMRSFNKICLHTQQAEQILVC